MEQKAYDPRHEKPRKALEVSEIKEPADHTGPDVMAGHQVKYETVAVVGIGFALKKSK